MASNYPLSLVLIASNEEARIERCLKSAAHLAKQVVVVVNDCKDRTEEIAKSFGAEIFEHPWHGYRDQKNIALEYVKQPWVLALDCDEELSIELQGEIKSFFENEGTKIYETACFPRKVKFLGKWITHGEWYPDLSVRLFKKDVRWTGSPEHDKIEVVGKRKRFKADCYHYSCPSISNQILKFNTFSDYFLNRQLDASKKWSAFQAIFRAFWRFFRSYVIKLGFLDGYAGFYIASVAGFSTLVRYSRLYEYLKDEQVRQETDDLREKSRV
jgi:glycosyltransferase involved in cell wall biosynthesis